MSVFLSISTEFLMRRIFDMIGWSKGDEDGECLIRKEGFRKETVAAPLTDDDILVISSKLDTLDEGVGPSENLHYCIPPQDVVHLIETELYHVEADFDWCPGVGRGLRKFVHVVRRMMWVFWPIQENICLPSSRARTDRNESSAGLSLSSDQPSLRCLAVLIKVRYTHVYSSRWVVSSIIGYSLADEGRCPWHDKRIPLLVCAG